MHVSPLSGVGSSPAVRVADMPYRERGDGVSVPPPCTNGQAIDMYPAWSQPMLPAGAMGPTAGRPAQAAARGDRRPADAIPGELLVSGPFAVTGPLQTIMFDGNRD
jgi:hypothetical protein